MWPAPLPLLGSTVVSRESIGGVIVGVRCDDSGALTSSVLDMLPLSGCCGVTTAAVGVVTVGAADVVGLAEKIV